MSLQCRSFSMGFVNENDYDDYGIDELIYDTIQPKDIAININININKQTTIEELKNPIIRL